MQIPEEVIDEFKPCDDRGRVTLGSKYKNKKVKLAVLEEKGCTCGPDEGCSESPTNEVKE